MCNDKLCNLHNNIIKHKRIFLLLTEQERNPYINNYLKIQLVCDILINNIHQKTTPHFIILQIPPPLFATKEICA